LCCLSLSTLQGKNEDPYKKLDYLISTFA